MNTVDVSRWQFGITTVYHYIFVPLTIGLAPLVAIMQTCCHVTGKDSWLRLTKFFGKLLLINFAIGVATGIVFEFQFGMNWSQYSRYVGDVFGAPLALEALIAFFMESVFLGIWIFGWGRLPKKVHLATIWFVAVGVNVSAYFILAANSFMQHPVGARFNPEKKRAELDSIFALLTNSTNIVAFSHVVAAAFLTASTFVVAIAGWWMVREARGGSPEKREVARSLWRPGLRLGLLVVLIAGIGVALTGDIQGKVMFDQQPMKMASAESLCQTEENPKFSVLTIGTHNNCQSVTHLLEVPYVLGFLAKGTFGDVTLQGVENLQQSYVDQYGPGNYSPNLFVTYWSFRMMIGLAIGSALLFFAGYWVTRKNRVAYQKWFSYLCLIALPTPFLANSAGWVFTEMGRQPWVVVPNRTGDGMIHLRVEEGVSPHQPGTVLFSLIAFTLLYSFLAAIWFYLLRRYTLAGPEGAMAHHIEPDNNPNGPDTGRHRKPDGPTDQDDQLSFAY
ncbi:cytochrome ubiquinol oxidase subunit I [Nocardia camponoti]|uniref:cytochrome ubiquinol oxidase subunit I n=1 Tax=Nocardia camponoti TaxID=1616106 RepID=UPI00166BD43B|nr:cytochrome ubiquinol oxidase subunit I [Nocardia camponoti]